MTGAVVLQPEVEHVCGPPCGGPVAHMLYPRGAVWRCDCDRTWVSLGLQHGPFRGGYEAPALEWRREGHRSRRRRELAETCP